MYPKKNARKPAKTLVLVVTVALAVAGIVCQPNFSYGADHDEAPGIDGAEGSQFDITDIFAFKSPVDPNNLVLVLGIFTPVGGPGLPLFSDRGRYELYIDTNEDTVPETTIRTTFSTNADGSQTFRISGLPGVGGVITGPVNTGAEADVTERGGAKAYAGLRDDHFFFDLTAFAALIAAPCIPAAGLRCPGGGDPSNFFGSFNTATVVVEFPTTNLPGISSPDSGSLKIWSKTFSQQ